jgi:hypothetical protein
MTRFALLLPTLLLLLSPGPSTVSAQQQWPYHPVGSPSPPEVNNTSWPITPIDRFILSRLEQSGLTPADTASRDVLLRRVTFDLIGLPPTPAQRQKFLRDTSPGAYETVVDRLLEDPRHGERWARFWLDLARYADTAGYEGDPDLPHAWRYRDYVIDSFNRDKAYDLFIKEQLAGDEFAEVLGAGELPPLDPERVVAMTFLRLAPFTEPRGDETRHEMLSEITTTVGSVFLGLSVGCAKCHDHKHDPIPIEDFYRMKSFFATVSIPAPLRGDGFQIGGSLPAAFYRKGEKEWVAKRLANLRKDATAVKQQLAQLSDSLGKRIQPPPSKQQPLETLINDPATTGITDRERDNFRMLSRRTRAIPSDIKRLQPLAMSLRHTFGPPYEPGVPTSRVMLRGEYNNPGDVVLPGFLSCLTGHQKPAAIRLDPFKRWPTRSRRMALARWIASKQNPLTARVMVNRLWHWHFGQGLVATPSDFGAMRIGPSHQELIDWLAHHFTDNGWSLKTMHRLMVLSATYRQTSRTPNSKATAVDPGNRLLWRFRRRRLEAEAVRDSVLFVAGRLNPEHFGLPIFPMLPDNVADRVKWNSSKWFTHDDYRSRKRSIYIYQQRSLSMPFMQAFDSLVCEQSRPLRRESVTPLQALAMYNGLFANQEALHFAATIRQQAPDDPSGQIQLAFLIAYNRPPETEETSRLIRFLETTSPEPLVSLCRVLLNSNEFVTID